MKIAAQRQEEAWWRQEIKAQEQIPFPALACVIFFPLHVFIFFQGKVKRPKKATDGIDILCKWVLCSQKTSLLSKVWLEFHKITDILKSNITDASVAAVASVTPS